MASGGKSGAPRLRARARYWFDSTLLRGSGAALVWLAIATAAVVGVAGILLAIAKFAASGGEQVGIVEGIWLMLVRTLDPGTMGQDAGWGFRLIALSATVGGIFIVSSLIGLISNGIDRRLTELGKGRSQVVETGHTLILGWSHRVPTIVSEIVEANLSESHACVVIMSPLDVATMKDAVAARVPRTKPTRLVYRTGEVSDLEDLRLVNPAGAKSIVVVLPEAESPDAVVTKTVLALVNEDLSVMAPIVAEFAASGAAQSVELATGGRVISVLTDHIVDAIAAQAFRQPGLSATYQDLLDFAGDEIYFHTDARIVGKTFREAAFAFAESTLIGLRHGNGEIEISPDPSLVVADDDTAILIAEDDSTIVFTGVQIPEGGTSGASPAAGGKSSLPTRQQEAPQHRSKRHLIVGWNNLGRRLVDELDRATSGGSELTLVVDKNLVNPDEFDWVESLTNLSAEVVETDGDDQTILETLVGPDTHDHTVVLCYREGVSTLEADARVLMTQFHLHQLMADPDSGVLNERISVELADPKDFSLAQAVGRHDDFVISARLGSLLLAHLSENSELWTVFQSLLDPEGISICVESAANYVNLGSSYSFNEVMGAAFAKGKIAIGYRLDPSEGSRPNSGHVILNPPKSELIDFEDGDEVIVVHQAA